MTIELEGVESLLFLLYERIGIHVRINLGCPHNIKNVGNGNTISTIKIHLLFRFIGTRACKRKKVGPFLITTLAEFIHRSFLSAMFMTMSFGLTGPPREGCGTGLECNNGWRLPYPELVYFGHFYPLLRLYYVVPVIIYLFGFSNYREPLHLQIQNIKRLKIIFTITRDIAYLEYAEIVDLWTNTNPTISDFCKCTSGSYMGISNKSLCIRCTNRQQSARGKMFEGKLPEEIDTYFSPFRRCNYPQVTASGTVEIVYECGRYANRERGKIERKKSNGNSNFNRKKTEIKKQKRGRKLITPIQKDSSEEEKNINDLAFDNEKVNEPNENNFDDNFDKAIDTNAEVKKDD
ncbi:hypothetical protein PGB90_010365 [Kerria lacca]